MFAGLMSLLFSVALFLVYWLVLRCYVNGLGLLIAGVCGLICFVLQFVARRYLVGFRFWLVLQWLVFCFLPFCLCLKCGSLVFFLGLLRHCCV